MYPGQQPGLNDELISFLDLAPTVLSLAGVEPPVHMQGRALLGHFARNRPAPDYVYAARDRFDEQYDLQRAVRDTRFKYIRNYRPDKPYVLWMAYANVMPTMQELFRLNAAGELNATQSLWMASSRPVHELYDTVSDPHEIRNLAYDPAYSTELGRLQGALDEWMDTSGDRGLSSELDMVADFWPQGVQPLTEAPRIYPRATAQTGIPVGDAPPTPSGGQFEGPVEIMMYSPTQGASIEYTIVNESAQEQPWHLYAGPITLDSTVTLRARAVRYGYAHSGVTEATFVVAHTP